MKKFLPDIFFTVIGSALVGISLPMFTIPNDIAPGGVSGLATALAHITPWHVSVWTLLLNVPLLIGAWNLLGKRSLVFTVISTLLVSAFIELGARFLPEYRNDVLMAAFYGGILGGAGIGMLFARGISTGGTDLLALMLKKYIPNISSGTLLMAVDLSVVVFAVCVFRNIDVALYSAVTIFVMSRVIDALTQGVDYAKVVYVVTARGREVADALARRCTNDSYRPPLKWHAPIASVAALIERHAGWQVIGRHRRTHTPCRGADSRARHCTCEINRLSLKW